MSRGIPREDGPHLKTEVWHAIVAEKVQRRDEELARMWLDGRTLSALAAGAGREIRELRDAIAWALLRLGEVTMDEMAHHGFHKPKRSRP